MGKVVETVKDIVLTFSLIALWGVTSQFVLNLLRGTDYGFTKPYDVTGYLFFGVFLAGLWEEAAFRYAPITIGKKFDLVLPVVCISSILFGWLHGNGPQGVFVQGGYGFIFSWTYLHARQVPYLVNVVAHSMWNLMFVFLPH